MQQTTNSEKIKVSDSVDQLRYLIFSLQAEEYSIPLLNVREVIALTEARAIPYAPPHFRGLINLRGKLISIIDLKTKLNLGKSVNGPETSIIILDLNELSLGIIVDSIECVMLFRPEEMSEAPIASNKDGYIKSIAKKDKRLILNLDIEATLNVTDKNIIAGKNLQNIA